MVKPEQRAAMLTESRNRKMARSAHAYVRGSTVKFYEWLEASAEKVPNGPPVWICGDCHSGNLGPIADTKGRVAIQIRDLDQTVIGNPAHDLIRLGLSLASTARSSDLPGVTTAKIIEELIAGYKIGLAGDFQQNDRSNRPAPIQALIANSVHRRWRHLAQDRLKSGFELPRGKRFWPLAPDERAALAEMFNSDSARELFQTITGREDESIKLIDAAYWVKGCSSLGRLRYACLLRAGRGRTASRCLIDVKEGVTAAAPRNPKAKMPRDNAVRVVTGARVLSPYLGQRMAPARLLDRAVVLRELMPQDLKVEIDQLTELEAKDIARYLAGVLGRAHGRQMKPRIRAGWIKVLEQNHASLEAPPWLWSSVVELLVLHEAAYLEHCRRYALAAAA